MNLINEDNNLRFLIRAACIIIIIGGMKLSSDILTPFFLAMFISIVASQPVNWLFLKGIPKWISIIIVMLLMVSFAGFMGGLIGSAVGQFTQNLPSLNQNIKEELSLLLASLDNIGISISNQKIINAIDPSKIMGFTASTLNGMGNVLGQTFIIIFISLFMLFELDSFPTKYKIITSNIENPRQFNFSRIIHNVRNYLGIKSLTSLATGLIIALGLKLIGVPYPFLWGLIAYLMNYIPNIGSLIAAIPALLFALIENGLGDMLWTVLLYALTNVVIGNIIEPKVMGKGLGLSTLVVLLSLIFWGWVFGPIGMFLSVPFTMSIKIILETNDSSRWLSVFLDSESNANTLWDNLKNKSH